MKTVEQYVKQFKEHDYLGDGAYVGYTGYSYVLFTTDGMSIQNEVHLEKHEITAFNRFVKRVTDENG